MSWLSFAEWPEGVYSNVYDEPISEDTHRTEGAAKAVCRALERDGFGGDRQHFPVRTWTKEVLPLTTETETEQL